jgi:hypothetical protein
MHGSDEKFIKILVGIPNEKKPPNGIRHTWEDNIKWI